MNAVAEVVSACFFNKRHLDDSISYGTQLRSDEVLMKSLLSDPIVLRELRLVTESPPSRQ